MQKWSLLEAVAGAATLRRWRCSHKAQGLCLHKQERDQLNALGLFFGASGSRLCLCLPPADWDDPSSRSLGYKRSPAEEQN